MFILLPIPVIHSITEQKEGATVALVPINFKVVSKIEEDLETGFANIHYHSGEVIESLMPFVKVMESLSIQNAVNYLGLQECRKISKSLDAYVKSTGL